MRKSAAYLLLFVYNNISKRNSIRTLIKKVLGCDRITIDFANFKIMTSVNSAIESNLMFNEYTEMEILSLIKKYTASGYNFVDIGANVGIHSLTAAKSNPQIDIYSFEPEPNNYQHFLDNIVLNGFLNIRPFKMGLGNVSQNFTLNVNPGWNKGKHSLKMEFDSPGYKTQIPVTKLDLFKDNINCQCLFIKIDVEGFEKEVIEGAQQIFSQTPNIIVVIELLSEINGHDNCAAISKSLMEHHFGHMFRIGRDHIIKKVDGFDESSDYIFIKGEDALARFES